MLIQAYGLFWRAEEVEWTPGAGRRGEFRLLGRIGANRGTIRVADMREQLGLYVLHNNWGVYYVGLTLRQSLGKRLKDHCSDEHEDQWDRFSWFGFRQVLKRTDEVGICELKALSNLTLGKPDDAVKDLEALLIQLHNPQGNHQQMSFRRADAWTQIDWHDVDTYLARL
jgi:hypothetical protein